jgi:GR25 family glycosyltransferase involved in LPS biosynthesis
MIFGPRRIPNNIKPTRYAFQQCLELIVPEDDFLKNNLITEIQNTVYRKCNSFCKVKNV